MLNVPARPPVVLCIAGFDPCGGAGLLADARAVAAFGAHALAAQTALVPQNTVGVAAIFPTAPALLQQQLEVLSADIAFDAVKIGLLPDVSSIEIIGEFLRQQRESKPFPIVVDPVLAPTRGQSWSDDATIEALSEHIFPLATMLTPNLPEAQILSGATIGDLKAMQTVARDLRARSGAQIVLLKGGHLNDSPSDNSRTVSPTVDDVYADASGIEILSAPRVSGVGVRGTGCLLASAIAAQLAQDVPPLEAAKRAKIWMTTQWTQAHALGAGRRVAIF